MKFWQAIAFLEPLDEQLAPLTRATEAAGFHGVAVSDHLFYPRTLESQYPYTADGQPMWKPETPWPDPWTAIAYMAAITSTLRFTTNITIAPGKETLALAKQVGTAAVLSRNRVSLGVGVGWSREEFDAAGFDFRTRGKRLNEQMQAMRALWGDEWASFDGEHVQVPEVRMEPRPTEPVPILVGGDSPAAIRRATTLGDGWLGVGYSAAVAEEKVAEVQKGLADAGRGTDDFEIILTLYEAPDLDLYRRFADLGVTGMVWAPWMMADPAIAEREGLLAARVEATLRFGDEFIARF